MDYASEIVKIVREEQAEQAAKLAAAYFCVECGSTL